LDVRVLEAHGKDPHPAQLHALAQQLDRPAQGARATGLNDIAELADMLDRAYRALETPGYPAVESFLVAAHEAHELLISMMDQVAAGLATRPDATLLSHLADLAELQPSAPLEQTPRADLTDIDAGLGASLNLPELTWTEAT